MPRTASDKRMAERWRKHARDLEKELGDPRTSGIARYAKKILKGDEAFWLWTALTTDIALWQIARAEARLSLESLRPISNACRREQTWRRLKDAPSTSGTCGRDSSILCWRAGTGTVNRVYLRATRTSIGWMASIER